MSAAVLRDAGFGDLHAARLIVRRLRMRAALQEARKSIEGLLDCLDEGFEADRDAHAALLDEAGGLAAGTVECAQRNGTVSGIARDDVREKELLEGTKMILQFLDALGVGLRHGLFSSSYAAERNADGDAAHRLSGAAK